MIKISPRKGITAMSKRIEKKLLTALKTGDWYLYACLRNNAINYGRPYHKLSVAYETWIGL